MLSQKGKGPENEPAAAAFWVILPETIPDCCKNGSYCENLTILGPERISTTKAMIYKRIVLKSSVKSSPAHRLLETLADHLRLM
jgi:hypothetical protein